MKVLLVALALLAPAAAVAALAPEVDVGGDRLAMPEAPDFPELAQTHDLAIPHNLGPLTEEFADRSEALPFPAPTVLFNGDAFVVQDASGDGFTIPNVLNAGETRLDDQYLYPAEFGAWSADLQNDVAQALLLGDAALPDGLLVPRAQMGLGPDAVPELELDFDLVEGDISACAVSCSLAPGDADALAAAVSGLAGLARAEGLAGAMPLASGEAMPAPAMDVGAPPAPLHPAERPGSAPLAAQSAGPLPFLGGDAATLLAAAAAVAVGLLIALPLALYSKIRRDMTLVNDTRRAVFEAVVNHPGLSIQEVARRAEISHSTAAYHLDRLASAGLVVATGDGNKVRYYRNGGRFSEQERKLLPCLENAETVRVLETVLHRPWTYRAEVAQALGVTATTVNWHLKRLFGAGMLSEAREGRSAYLFVDRAALHAACHGLHEKVPDSPAREAAGRILAQLGPQVPATALPERPRTPGPTLIQAVAASVAAVPPPVSHAQPAPVSTHFSP